MSKSIDHGPGPFATLLQAITARTQLHGVLSQTIAGSLSRVPMHACFPRDHRGLVLLTPIKKTMYFPTHRGNLESRMRIFPKALLKRNHSRKIFWFLGGLSTLLFIPILVNWSSVIIDGNAVLTLINRSVSIYVPDLAFLSIFSILTALYIYNGFVDLNDKLDRVTTERDSLLGYVEELKQEQFVDPITGIPNNLLWEIHLDRIISQTNKANSFQAMIIDLVDFRSMNRKFTPSKADKVLLKIAQDLRGGMRRNEQMYRRRRIDIPFISDNDFPDQDIYRKYRGGDEFYIYIKGNEAEAIGFLIRFHKLLRTKISEEASKNILGKPIELLFYGAICPVYSGDKVETVAARLDDLLITAKYNGRSRLIWYSSSKIDGVKYDDKEKSMHEEADKEFGVAV